MIDSNSLVTSDHYPVSYLKVKSGILNHIGEVYNSDGSYIDFPRELPSKIRKDLDISSVTKKLINQTVACVVHERENYSYFHWTYETLPKLIYLSNHRQQLKFDRIYLPQSFFGRLYQGQTLRNLGFNFWEVIDSRKVKSLMAKEIIVLRLDEIQRNPSLKLCQMIKSSFIKQSNKKPNKRIYLTRENLSVHQGRKILNESDLRQLLLSYGFEIIIPDKLNVLQQYKLFNESSCIVSPHGAALANIVFCERGTKILELSHRAESIPLYSNIARICTFDLIQLDPKEIIINEQNFNEHRADFIVDLDAIESTISNWFITNKV